MASESSLREFNLSVPQSPLTGLTHAVMSGLEAVQQMMMEFDQKVNQIFSGGDPTVREWFLVRETYLPFLLGGCYILFCTLIGPAIMRNRKPFVLRGPMIIFNFAIVATYIGCLIVAAIYLPTIPWQSFCYSGTVIKGETSYTLACTAWVVYIIKYVEYLDTVFFVLRKKTNQMSLLHLFHHMAVPIIAWIMMRTESNGIQSVPGLINSFVHVIMYTYYGLTAIGPQVQKYLWWKKYLTQLQMAQFIIIILFVTVVAPLTGCTMLIMGRIVIMATVPTFLYLFYKFYKVTFRQKKD